MPVQINCEDLLKKAVDKITAVKSMAQPARRGQEKNDL